MILIGGTVPGVTKMATNVHLTMVYLTIKTKNSKKDNIASIGRIISRTVAEKVKLYEIFYLTSTT